MVDNTSWDRFQYVGLTLNQAQVQSASRKIYQEVSNASRLTADSFALFCADAARPETWKPRTRAAVEALADAQFSERWLLALDCLYHFKRESHPPGEIATVFILAAVCVRGEELVQEITVPSADFETVESCLPHPFSALGKLPN